MLSKFYRAPSCPSTCRGIRPFHHRTSRFRRSPLFFLQAKVDAQQKHSTPWCQSWCSASVHLLAFQAGKRFFQKQPSSTEIPASQTDTESMLIPRPLMEHVITASFSSGWPHLTHCSPMCPAQCNRPTHGSGATESWQARKILNFQSFQLAVSAHSTLRTGEPSSRSTPEHAAKNSQLTV